METLVLTTTLLLQDTSDSTLTQSASSDAYGDPSTYGSGRNTRGNDGGSS